EATLLFILKDLSEKISLEQYFKQRTEEIETLEEELIKQYDASQQLAHEKSTYQQDVRQHIEALQTTQEELIKQYRTAQKLQNELTTRIEVLNTTAIVSETDIYGTITFVNDTFCRIAQYTPEELIGQPHNIVRHPDMPSEVFQEMWNTIKAGKIFQGIIKNKAKDGTPYWVMATVAPIKDENDQIYKYMGVRIDITQLMLQENQLLEQSKELQQQSEELRQTIEEIQTQQEVIREQKELTEAVVETAVDGIVMTNEKGIIISINQAISDIFGFRREELLGKNVSILMPDPYAQEHDAHMARYMKTHEKHVVGIGREVQGKRKNGEVFPMHLALSEVNTYNETIFTGFVRDLTTTKQLEEERIAKAVLERKHKNTTDSIQYALRIQEAILPPKDLIDNFLGDYFIYHKPKDIVSGDFHWFSYTDRYIFLAAIDCTGHGVPGAFMSLVGYTGLNKIVEEYGEYDPAKILTYLDQHVIDTLKQDQSSTQQTVSDGMDIALCRIDLSTQELVYAGAHNPLYLFRNKQLYELKADKFAVGGHIPTSRRPYQKSFRNHAIKLERGDSIYLFSDGFRDQFGSNENIKYMTKNFKKLLSTIHQKPMEEQQALLEKELKEWKGDYRQIDDVLVIGVRFSFKF
ncbi:MAG: PAS domain S-box protein, partial [Bacteroidota bacterium]